MVFFLLIRIPYSLVLLDIPSGEELCVIILGEIVRDLFRDYGAYFTCKNVRDGFYALCKEMMFEKEMS